MGAPPQGYPSPILGSVLKTLTNLVVAANGNIFIPDDVRAPSFGKIFVLFTSNIRGTLSAVINGIPGALNDGKEISPNTWHVFELPVYPNMSINFKFSANATISIIVIYQSA